MLAKTKEFEEHLNYLDEVTVNVIEEEQKALDEEDKQKRKLVEKYMTLKRKRAEKEELLTSKRQKTSERYDKLKQMCFKEVNTEVRNESVSEKIGKKEMKI